ncbi:uncharacterized [Tachysurus ichikawai]
MKSQSTQKETGITPPTPISINTVTIIKLDTNIILYAQFNTHAFLIKATAVMPQSQSPPSSPQAAKDVPQPVNDGVYTRYTQHPNSTNQA